METSSEGTELFHGNGQTGETDRQKNERTSERTDGRRERRTKKADRHDEDNSRISQFCECA
jgi:hypothetical protein